MNLPKMKTIPIFPNYAITKDGRVWSKSRITPHGHHRKGRWLASRIIRKYWNTTLFMNLQRHTCKVHRLILQTFVGPCPAGMQCRHLNGNPSDNRLDNLCWGTPGENQTDRIEHGTLSVNQGKKYGMVKLTEQSVRMIVYMYRTGLFPQREIAKIYNTASSHISNIVNKRRWRHLWSN